MAGSKQRGRSTRSRTPAADDVAASQRGDQSSGVRRALRKKSEGAQSIPEGVQSIPEDEAMDVGKGVAVAVKPNKDVPGGKSSKVKFKVTAGQAAESMPLLCKMGCSLLQSQRELEAVIFDIVLMPADHVVIKGMQDSTKEWMAEVRDAGKGHDLGPPFLRAWDALLSKLCEADVGAKNKKILKDFKEEEGDVTVEEQVLYIRACRIKKTFKVETVKLVLAFKGDIVEKQVRPATLAALKQLGGEVKTGRAPAGAFERTLQELLERWQV